MPEINFYHELTFFNSPLAGVSLKKELILSNRILAFVNHKRYPNRLDYTPELLIILAVPNKIELMQKSFSITERIRN